MDRNFYINNRFFIEPAANLVTDKLHGTESRIEARLIQLLVILAQRKGKTVSREELVNLIWQDYGGGDEGLTQAISILRKVLLDNTKGLIQTVPKKGYILNAVISENMKSTERFNNGKRPLHKYRKWYIGSCITILVLTVFIIILKSNSGDKKVSPIPTNVDYPINLTQEEALEENEKNTIITQAADSTIYKLVIIEDRPPKFFINNNRIPEDKWEPYMPLINSLKGKLKDKNN